MSIRDIINWVKPYFYLTRSAFFILGLPFAHGLVKNAVVDSLILYLTDYSKLVKSAVIVNMQEAIAPILAMVIAHISDSWIGRFKSVLCTTVLYITGLVALYLSARFYTEEVKYKIFYPALLLIVIGHVGKDPPLKAFLADQFPEGTNTDDVLGGPVSFWWFIMKLLGASVSVIFMSTTSWRRIFEISAIVMAAACLWFLIGKVIRLYYCERPTTSPLITTLYKVFKAAICKRKYEYPDAPDGYFMNTYNELEFSPRHKILRRIDKAAIIGDSTRNQVQCQVSQVKYAKRLLTLIPLWMTFLIYSMVQAAGSTFFIKQSDGMKMAKINKFQIRLTVLFVLQSTAKAITSFLVNLIISKKCIETWKQQRAELVKINAGMFSAILCCLAALQVEVHRLKLLSKYDALESENEYDLIPMSICWLVPQFFLLGVMAGLAENGLSQFFYNHVDGSMRHLEVPINEFMIGIGKFVIALFVLFHKSWFGDTMNQSRLDKYFLFLMILCCCNLCISIVVSYKYAILESQQYNFLEQSLQDAQQLHQQIQQHEQANIQKQSQDEAQQVELQIQQIFCW